MSGCDILLDPKGTAEIRFTNSLGETMRVLAVEDQYVMLDMAAQLTTAVLTLQERRVASKS
jgi:predicted component of type VI protein secretion system